MNSEKLGCKEINEVALYIHIPFCKQKCLYCDFPSFSGKEKLMLEYSQALAKDINSIGERNIKTIFIGGGTPTYLSLEAWNNIKNSIDKLDKTLNLEFTVEGNPGTFTEEKLKFLKTMGVNRLSIGLQAWQNSMLKKLGRVHTVEEFIESYRLARNIGFNNINVDLMFGLPDQSYDNWKETLEQIVEMEPEHISCYSLIIEENTHFCKMYDEEKFKLPEEEVERKMYRFAVDFLKSNGYHQYEISNFSKKNKECNHNLIYWNLEEYVGCGSASHSYVDGVRYRKAENIEEYIAGVNLGANLQLDVHENSVKEDMEEFMFMGLRKIAGISIDEFYKRFNVEIYSIYGDVIRKHVCDGLLVENKGNLFLSDRGIEVSNVVMSDFLLD
ncbi:radical SAM family heme chaperone HemW [Clostridium magnum]|uniref:Heme chaperone HemW n=1 Tax=Clostridium magnum DSM 2767 TaxID=1121326 RepID=A0A162UGK6_9CLOT|nr:radical SAM family heme chaperone HemW [Clostridium magnum]KZL93877.1 oxygen-independent coproporphyrinogen-III oxidase-like protein YqeR [Clostridium magnum DSM 2767]SHH97699.1 coproporphyrinogen III oxidase, anaerobic [Clostridium magnum DSM 2767]